MLLQSGGPTAVVGTLVLFALYLSVTAHLAARNVLGDVPPRTALAVGPVPAIVAAVGVTAGLPPALTVVAAVGLDFAAIRYAYDRPRAVAAYVTVIHLVITVLIAIVLGGIARLLATRPNAALLAAGLPRGDADA